MKLISRSVSDTLKIGRLIAKELKSRDVVCLFGEFGTGKTILTKGIAWGLGIRKNIVVSPSFILLREYRAKKNTLYHFDFYRLRGEGDILNLGYEEYFYDDGITVIEWADRLKYLLPKEHLKIQLSIRKDSGRDLGFSGRGQHYKDLIKKIYENIRH